MDNRLTFLAGIGIGLGLAYGSKMIRDAERGGQFGDQIGRARSLLAVLRRRVSPSHLSDQVLIEQVRSEIDRVLERPHGIEVQAAHGHVRLAGAIRDDEVDEVVARVTQLPGVRGVDNQLVVVESRVGRAS